MKPQLDKWVVAFFIFVILTTPLGVGVGMAIGQTTNMFLVVIQGLAGGVLIYIALNDLIIHEFHKSHDLPKLSESKRSNETHMQNRKSAQMKITFFKFLFQLLGAGFVILLLAVSPEHSH